MKWGIIGTGNMGKVLLHALTTSGAVSENDMYLYNRTFMKAYELLNEYPEAQVAKNLKSITKACDVLFLCAKPKEIVAIAQDIQSYVHQKHIVISITSSISTDQLDHILPCKTARMIPSITNQSLKGATLLSYGTRLNKQERQLLLQTCKLFSEPIVVEENIVRTASDLVSCGPAFISYLLEDMIKSVQLETEIDRKTAESLVEVMMVGFGKLLEEKHFSLESLREKVMVKGGITGVGMEALENEITESFRNVFIQTHKKFSLEQEMVEDLIHEVNQR